MKFNRIEKQPVEAVQLLDVDWDGISFSEYPFSDKPYWLVNLFYDRKIKPFKTDRNKLLWIVEIDNQPRTAYPGQYIVFDILRRKIYLVEEQEFKDNYSIKETD